MRGVTRTSGRDSGLVVPTELCDERLLALDMAVTCARQRYNDARKGIDLVSFNRYKHIVYKSLTECPHNPLVVWHRRHSTYAGREELLLQEVNHSRIASYEYISSKMSR